MKHFIFTIKEELKLLEINDRVLRKFGILLFIALIGIFSYQYWRHQRVLLWLVAAATLFFICGLFIPYSLKYFYRLWMGFAFVAGWIMTNVILFLSFFLIIIPTGILLRICGKDLLDEKIDKNKVSYWKKREHLRDSSSYLKQF